MSNAKVEITAEDNDTATALAAAVKIGLEISGFLNASSDTEAEESETLLDQMRSRSPEIFDTNVEISCAAIVPSEALDVVDEEDAGEEVIEA